jgi:hypothetical protein
MANKPRNRYLYFNLSMSANAMLEVRKECFALQISKQEFFRALTRDYFLRNKGIDIMLQKNERIHKDAE